MSINKSNMEKLFDFVDVFPHYMIGSNSDLPITGGSGTVVIIVAGIAVIALGIIIFKKGNKKQ